MEHVLKTQEGMPSGSAALRALTLLSFSLLTSASVTCRLTSGGHCAAVTGLLRCMCFEASIKVAEFVQESGTGVASNTVLDL